tara:strand:- start:1255 stop:1488 length:234 start_codon:yes stop_codon:yes gene_type:complete
MTELEKRMGYKINTLVGHLCCENCYKHYVMALAKLENILDVKHLHDAVMFVSQKKQLPIAVQNLFDLKFKKLEGEKV